MIAFERLLSKVQAVQKAQHYCWRYYPPKKTLPRELKRNLLTNTTYHENVALCKPWELKNNNKTKVEQIDQNLSSQAICMTVLRQHRFILLKKNTVQCSTCSFHWGVLALQRSSLLPHPSVHLKVLLNPQQCPLLCLSLLTLSRHHFTHSMFSGKNSKMPQTKSTKARDDFFIFKQASTILASLCLN